MRMYLVYSTTNGEVLISGLRQKQSAIDNVARMADTAYVGYVYADGTTPNNYYFPGGVKTARPKFSVETGRTTLTVGEQTFISGIPSGAKLTGGKYIQESVSGNFPFSFSRPGTVVMLLELFPYISKAIPFYIRANS